jgi:hypothetical protein
MEGGRNRGERASLMRVNGREGMGRGETRPVRRARVRVCVWESRRIGQGRRRENNERRSRI